MKYTGLGKKKPLGQNNTTNSMNDAWKRASLPAQTLVGQENAAPQSSKEKGNLLSRKVETLRPEKSSKKKTLMGYLKLDRTLDRGSLSPEKVEVALSPSTLGSHAKNYVSMGPSDKNTTKPENRRPESSMGFSYIAKHNERSRHFSELPLDEDTENEELAFLMNLHESSVPNTWRNTNSFHSPTKNEETEVDQSMQKYAKMVSPAKKTPNTEELENIGSQSVIGGNYVNTGNKKWKDSSEPPRGEGFEDNGPESLPGIGYISTGTKKWRHSSESPKEESVGHEDSESIMSSYGTSTASNTSGDAKHFPGLIKREKAEIDQSMEQGGNPLSVYANADKGKKPTHAYVGRKNIDKNNIDEKDKFTVYSLYTPFDSGIKSTELENEQEVSSVSEEVSAPNSNPYEALDKGLESAREYYLRQTDKLVNDFKGLIEVFKNGLENKSVDTSMTSRRIIELSLVHAYHCNLCWSADTSEPESKDEDQEDSAFFLMGYIPEAIDLLMKAADLDDMYNYDNIRRLMSEAAKAGHPLVQISFALCKNNEELAKNLCLESVYGSLKESERKGKTTLLDMLQTLLANHWNAASRLLNPHMALAEEYPEISIYNDLAKIAARKKTSALTTNYLK